MVAAARPTAAKATGGTATQAAAVVVETAAAETAAAETAAAATGEAAATAAADRFVLIVGLGNPGDRYAPTRHNLGFEVATELSRRWGLGRERDRFRGAIADGRIRPGGPRVAVLRPQTFMNESGDSAGPARGSLRVPIHHTVVIHDEIDLEFGTIRTRLGGGVAGHNGLKSLREGFGSADFWRVRVGVGRPDSTDPDVVSAYVLSRFAEPAEDVRELIGRAAGETERLVDEIAAAEDEPATGD
jgi:PTH1 family peptidyl-tRNA hydrolase